MIVILGGGPAGRTAAVHLASAGQEVQLVESGVIGGQCLNYGCMVMCALNDAARSLHTTRNLYSLGILDSAPLIRFDGLMREMHAVQRTIAQILDAETRTAGADIRYGAEGKLDGKTLTIAGARVDADAVLVATGSKPAIPDIDGIELPGVYNPHTLSSMASLPDRMVVIGGGIMAAEIAYVFAQFGCEVTLVARSQILKHLDPKLKNLALKELADVHLHTHTTIEKISGSSHVESVTIRSGNSQDTFETDAVFIAAGLVPRTESLSGLKLGALGEVVVDKRMRTAITGVYAAGDVTGPPYLTPVSRQEGLVAAENILGRKCEMDYRCIPQYMSLNNEFGFFGEENPEAVSLSMPGPAGPGSFWEVPRSDTGVATIRIDPSNGRICGVSTAAPAGGIITAYMAFLARRGMNVHDFSDFREVHPMADGVYGLARYADEYMKKKKE
jgi:dihydrolipoamide dehydrogenase